MPPPPPELADDLLGEVFLRLPPDDPACLLRASLACKSWRRVLADPAFRQRHRELHRTPSVVGFLRIAETGPPCASRFVPSNPAYGRPGARDLPAEWLMLDCRHGRVLFLTPSPSLGTELNYDLVVWDPLTNEQRCLPRPSPPPTVVTFKAAVLCAAVSEGCDHRECHGGPFRVALVWTRRRADPLPFVMYARVYSSETGNWREPISVQQHTGTPFNVMPRTNFLSILVEDKLYFRCGFMSALEYDLGAQRLSIILGPEIWTIFMSMRDGGLGCMGLVEDQSSLHLQLWSGKAVSDSDEDFIFMQWTIYRSIDLEKLLPVGALPSPSLASVPLSDCRGVQLLGSVEGTDVIFVGTRTSNHSGAVYMVQLNSGRARKVFDECTAVIPYTSFCIPVTIASSSTKGPRDDTSRA